MPAKVGSSGFLVVGAIGFLLGFVAWLFWLLLVISALLYIFLGFGYPYYMSGIFFQNWTYALIFQSLLSLSLVLESFGCFAIKQKFGSNLAFACGILFLAVSAVLTSSLIMPLPSLPLPLLFIYSNPVPLLNVGLLVLGTTFMLIRKSLPTPGKALWIGLIFIIISAFTLTWFAMVVLYWGFEFWLALLGWLYAINSLATSWFMIQIRNS